MPDLAAALLDLLAAARHILLPPLHLALKLAPLPCLLNASRTLSLREYAWPPHIGLSIMCPWCLTCFK